MDETSAVRIENLSKRFGDGPTILDSISLSAGKGDFISIIGPSGSGKSTLLKIISGLSEPTSGSLLIEGQAQVGYVFQEPALLPWLTAAQNVELPLKIAGVLGAERESRIGSSLALVGLTDRSGYYPRQLSGGQRMRVSLARALTRAPDILLLDEPFGALDEMARHSLNEELLSIREKRGWTGFFVTHSVAEAVFLSNRIVILSAGPGRLVGEVAVDLPYPRTSETRFSPEYLQLTAEVSRRLQTL